MTTWQRVSAVLRGEGRIVRDPFDTLPSWALDGGAGSVVSVYSMDKNYESAWQTLSAVLRSFSGYSVDAETIAELMDSILEING